MGDCRRIIIKLDSIIQRIDEREEILRKILIKRPKDWLKVNQEIYKGTLTKELIELYTYQRGHLNTNEYPEMIKPSIKILSEVNLKIFNSYRKFLDPPIPFKVTDAGDEHFCFHYYKDFFFELTEDYSFKFQTSDDLDGQFAKVKRILEEKFYK